jgi:LuxR family quorum sensing-dependent transcriptional regulator
MSAVEYGREALDFIEWLAAYRNVPDAMDALATAFGRDGFEHIIVTGLPNPDQQFSQMVLAKRWPVEWFSLYTVKCYARVDPVIRMCRQTVNPFEWSEAPCDAEREAGAGAAEVMRCAVDFRMSRGFVVPIHGLTGYGAGISLAGVGSTPPPSRRS